MQQRIVAWYGTVLAAVIFGGLVYASTDQVTPRPSVLFVLFGLTAPAVAIVANLLFLGELVRLGRAASIWRSLEHHVSNSPQLMIPVEQNRLLPPLMLETLYARTARDRMTGGYGAAAYYLTVLALFAGGWSLSFAVGLALTWGEGPFVEVSGESIPLMLVVGPIAILFWGLTTYRIARSILRMSKVRMDLTIPLKDVPSN